MRFQNFHWLVVFSIEGELYQEVEIRSAVLATILEETLKQAIWEAFQKGKRGGFVKVDPVDSAGNRSGGLTHTLTDTDELAKKHSVFGGLA